MANTVTADGLSIVTKGSDGEVNSVGPYQKGNSVITLPNKAASSDGNNTTETVLIEGCETFNNSSEISSSSNDEAGDIGVVSGTVGDKATPLSFSATVFLEGKPAVRNTDLFLPNSGNNPPAPISQNEDDSVVDSAISEEYELSNSVDALHFGVKVFQWSDDEETLNLINSNIYLEQDNKIFYAKSLLNFSDIKLTEEYPYGLTEFNNIPNTGEDEFKFWLGIDDSNACYKKEHYDLIPELYNKFDNKYPIPLFKTKGMPQTSPKDEREYNLELINIIPVMLNQDFEEEGEHSLSLLPNGWIYIFINGHLWREIEVTAKDKSDLDIYNFKDVNLIIEQGREKRVASCTAEYGVITIPTHDEDNALEVEMAFSPIQWGWDRVMSFGGMHVDDPRLIADKYEAKNSFYKATDAERSARLQKIDFTAFKSNRDNSSYIKEGVFATTKLKALERFSDDTLYPVMLSLNSPDEKAVLVTLCDPVSQAKVQSAKLLEKICLFSKTVADVQGVDMFGGQVVDDRETELQQLNFEASQMIKGMFFRQDEATNAEEQQSKLDEYKKNISEDKLNKFYKLEERQQLHKDILVEKQRLVNILSINLTGMVSFNNAVLDYAGRRDENVVEIYKLIKFIFGKLDYIPQAHDIELNLEQVDLDEIRGEDPGLDYLEKFLAAEGELKKLHEAVFPNLKDLSSIENADDSKDDLPLLKQMIEDVNFIDEEEIIPGNCRFNANMVMLARNSGKLVNKLSGSVIGNFGDTWGQLKFVNSEATTVLVKQFEAQKKADVAKQKLDLHEASIREHFDVHAAGKSPDNILKAIKSGDKVDAVAKKNNISNRKLIDKLDKFASSYNEYQLQTGNAGNAEKYFKEQEKKYNDKLKQNKRRIEQNKSYIENSKQIIDSKASPYKKRRATIIKKRLEADNNSLHSEQTMLKAKIRKLEKVKNKKINIQDKSSVKAVTDGLITATKVLKDIAKKPIMAKLAALQRCFGNYTAISIKTVGEGITGMSSPLMKNLTTPFELSAFRDFYEEYMKMGGKNKPNKMSPKTIRKLTPEKLEEFSALMTKTLTTYKITVADFNGSYVYGVENVKELNAKYAKKIGEVFEFLDIVSNNASDFFHGKISPNNFVSKFENEALGMLEKIKAGLHFRFGMDEVIFEIGSNAKSRTTDINTKDGHGLHVDNKKMKSLVEKEIKAAPVHTSLSKQGTHGVGLFVLAVTVLGFEVNSLLESVKAWEDKKISRADFVFGSMSIFSALSMGETYRRVVFSNANIADLTTFKDFLASSKQIDFNYTIHPNGRLFFTLETAAVGVSTVMFLYNLNNMRQELLTALNNQNMLAQSFKVVSFSGFTLLALADVSLLAINVRIVFNKFIADRVSYKIATSNIAIRALAHVTRIAMLRITGCNLVGRGILALANLGGFVGSAGWIGVGILITSLALEGLYYYWKDDELTSFLKALPWGTGNVESRYIEYPERLIQELLGMFNAPNVFIEDLDESDLSELPVKLQMSHSDNIADKTRVKVLNIAVPSFNSSSVLEIKLTLALINSTTSSRGMSVDFKKSNNVILNKNVQGPDDLEDTQLKGVGNLKFSDITYNEELATFQALCFLEPSLEVNFNTIRNYKYELEADLLYLPYGIDEKIGNKYKAIISSPIPKWDDADIKSMVSLPNAKRIEIRSFSY